MPSMKKEAHEQADDKANILDHHPELTISTKPVVVCGVNRKINVGNFENIDVYCGIALPVDVDFSNIDRDDFASIIESVAEYGFQLVSKETGARYRTIKESLS